MNIQEYIAEIPDFPKKGISFKDITPLLRAPEAFAYVVDKMAAFVKKHDATVIVAPEARGFLFAAPVAYASQTSLVLIRKTGKLPRKTVQKEYELEYGKTVLEMHQGDVGPKDRVIIIDDVLATGGTLKAIAELVAEQGAKVFGVSVLADITALHDEKLIKNWSFQSLVKY